MGPSAPFALDGRFGLGSAADVGEDRAEVVEGFAEHLIAWEGDNQVAAVFAYADAGRVDECCLGEVAVLSFHC